MSLDPATANAHFPDPPGVDPNASRVQELVGWSSTMVCLSGLAVALRLVSRWLVQQSHRRIHIEDWLAMLALIPAWMMCFITIYGTQHDNFGRHIGHSTPASLRSYLIGLWVFEHSYNFAITISKLSIISLWWRIFDVKSCRICLVAVGVVEFIWIVATTLTLVFSCNPIHGFWDLYVPSECIVQSRYWIGAAVPNIAIDVALLVLPNFWIMQLKINKSQKIALCFIFMLGMFVTVCSGLRLWQLILYNSQESVDLPWVTVGGAIWSLVEGNLSIVCCCLPSMRPLLRLLVHGRVNYGYDYARNTGSLPRPGRTPPADSGLPWHADDVPLKMVSTTRDVERDIDSPSTARESHQSWPIPPKRTYKTAALHDDRPDSGKQQDLYPANSNTWLRDTSNAGDTSRSTSNKPDSRQRSSGRADEQEVVSALSQSLTASTTDLHRRPSDLSVSAPGGVRR